MTNCRGLNREQLFSLNQTCQCVSMPEAVNASVVSVASGDSAGLMNETPPDRSHMIASTAVFVTQSDVELMQQQIDAIEATASLPGYRAAIATRSGTTDEYNGHTTSGLFMGYDFHLTADGPKLIEVNTNAGGAFIMQSLLARVRHHVSTCGSETLDDPDDVEYKIIDSFVEEWQSTGRSGRPGTVAIVDDSPQEQYLYPDMLLAKEMLARHGFNALITAPESLHIRNGRLYLQDVRIDLVYNRTTDFSLTEPMRQVLAQSIRQKAAVVSPNPSHHALFADKRNPVLWRDCMKMSNYGASDAVISTLSNLPVTEELHVEDEAAFWKRRKRLFFKPDAGYGSKATYRGDKVTRKVWSRMMEGGYIAQSLEPPPLRIVGEGVDSTLMKFDVRVFTYGGQKILMAARVYQGQTTNFRTPGGGFAPVVCLD